MVSALANFIIKNKGQVRCNSRVEGVLLEGSRAIGVKLADGQTLRAKHIVANTTLEGLYQNLLQGNRGRKAEPFMGCGPQTRPFSLFLGIRPGSCPGDGNLHLPARGSPKIRGRNQEPFSDPLP